jgi:cardiolipin synthase
MFQWIRPLLQRIRRLSLRKILFWYLLSLFVPPAIVSGVLVLVDTLRKKNRSQGHFLSLRKEPVIQVGTTNVRIYTYGNDLYEDMLEAIRHAQKRIELETFIWKGDEIGWQFKQEITEAAHRGVEVYVIYDQFANLVVPAEFKHFDPAIYVLKYPFFSLPFRPFQIRSYARDHRKVLIVDGSIGFIGGYNIGDVYATQWRDTHIRVIGEGALEIENSFVDFWNEHRRQEHPELAGPVGRSWSTTIFMQRNDPVTFAFPIRSSYLEALDRSAKFFYLTNAYFVPDAILLRYLTAAVQRGVDVRVLLPAISNHVVADWLARGFYTECLKGGVRLFLYQDAMVHAKTATADAQWSIVGSANLDRLSLMGNFEANLEFYDHGVALEMEKIFEFDSQRAHELTLGEWEKRPLLWRIAERLLYTFRPFF